MARVAGGTGETGGGRTRGPGCRAVGVERKGCSKRLLLCSESLIIQICTILLPVWINRETLSSLRISCLGTSLGPAAVVGLSTAPEGWVSYPLYTGASHWAEGEVGQRI